MVYAWNLLYIWLDLDFCKINPQVQICNKSGWTYIISGCAFSKKKIPQVQICNVSGRTCIFHIKNWNPIICMYPAGPAFLVSTQCPPKFLITLKIPARFIFLCRLMQQYIIHFQPKQQNAHPQSIFRPTGDRPPIHATWNTVISCIL